MQGSEREDGDGGLVSLMNRNIKKEKEMNDGKQRISSYAGKIRYVMASDSLFTVEYFNATEPSSMSAYSHARIHSLTTTHTHTAKLYSKLARCQAHNIHSNAQIEWHLYSLRSHSNDIQRNSH